MATIPIIINHMRSATIIDSENHYMSFDCRAGERNRPITCLCLFYASQDFLDDLEASKIVSVKEGSFYSYPSNGETVSCSFTLIPKFSYTNQRLEEIIYHLFEKYKL